MIFIMSNKKRIQKKISKIQLNKFQKFILAMKQFCLFFKEYKQRQKSLKLVSGSVKKVFAGSKDYTKATN